MGYQYRNQCLETLPELTAAVSADCPVLNSEGTMYISCVPSSTTVQITQYPLDQSTGNTIQISPNEIYCDEEQGINDATQLAWMVVGVWVAAWVIKKLAEVIKGRF